MSSASNAAVHDGNGLIRTLNEFDVLLGRGQGATNNCGNVAFRNLVDARRKQYLNSSSRNEKRRIGREIYEKITAQGGRFLKVLVSEGDVYEEVSVETSLEKCMQALREKHNSKKQGESKSTTDVTRTVEADAAPNQNEDDGAESEIAAEPDEAPSSLSFGQEIYHPMEDVSLNAIDATEIDWQGTPGNISETGDLNVLGDDSPTDISISSILPDTLYGSATTSVPPAFVDSRVLLYQPFVSHDQLLANALLQSKMRQFMLQRPFPIQSVMASLQEDTNEPSSTLKPYSTFAQGDKEDSDKLDECFLSMLGLGPEVPRFNGEDVITEEERVSVLSDMLGHLSLEGYHQKKRAKREYDLATVCFLVKQMKLELEQMPKQKKQLLLQVAAKCHPEELCDSRLEKFLRSQGMNVKLAAERFVNYWKERRDLFGEEKYCQRMILSEALRDDIIALRAGVFSILPHRDLSGRHLLLVHPSRHSREGYSTKSLLRALWYLIEVIVEESEHNLFVLLVDDKETTIWDFDPYLHNRMMYFLRSCWPMKDHPTHICGTTPIVLRLLKPVVFALLGKEARSRIVEHDASNESSLFESLSRYGIMKYMLPHCMGGPVRLDIEGWIIFRRSLEEEI